MNGIHFYDIFLHRLAKKTIFVAKILFTMRKIVPILILMLAFCSCSQDIRFNNEGVFQGIINNIFWVGGNAKATKDNTKMSIQALTLTEVVRLDFPLPPLNINPLKKDTFITYDLGTSTNRTAFYSITTLDGTNEFKTAIGVGDGQIVVSQYDGLTISGTFRFNAESTDPDSDETVNVQSGTLYKVPVY
jgi:Family of unknown function (DUF6252)